MSDFSVMHNAQLAIQRAKRAGFSVAVSGGQAVLQHPGCTSRGWRFDATWELEQWLDGFETALEFGAPNGGTETWVKVSEVRLILGSATVAPCDRGRVAQILGRMP